jgi:tetratricopeptide (TPR) repeat protein
VSSPALRRAIAAYESGQWADAEAVCADLLKADRNHPDALQLLGNIRARSGDTATAQVLFERARQAAPGNVFILNSLGGAYAANGRFAEAKEALEAALRIDGDFPWALQNLGGILMELGERAGAQRCFERAVMADPRHVESISALADLAERENRLEDARLLVRQALNLAPGFVGARVVDARLALRAGDDALAESILRDVLEQPNVSPKIRAIANMLLGRALERRQRYAEAFACFAIANAIERAVHASRFDGMDFPASTASIAKLNAFLETTDPATWTKPPADGLPTPVFLVGFPRSGTTLLQQVLAGHPDLATFEEKDNLHEAHRELLLAPGALERWSTLPRETLSKWRADFWHRVTKTSGELAAGRMYVDKLPMNLSVLPVIHLLFPGAKILFVLRDPRDVVVSCFRSQFAMNAAMFQFLTLEGAARFYDSVMSIAERSRDRLPIDVHVVRYEDIVDNLPREARRALDFLGLPWADDVLNFTETAGRRAIFTPSATQVIKPIYASSMGQWRHYEAELASIRPILAPWVSKFGYEDIGTTNF